MKQIGLHNDGMKNTAITQRWSPTTDTQWPHDHSTSKHSY